MAKKVLLVDDEPDIVTLTKLILDKNGFEVTTASDGKEGLQKAQEQIPDLIILDMRMPKATGDEVAVELMQHPQTKDIPIIFFTNSLDIDAVSQDMKQKGLLPQGRRCAFLSKSCSNEELLSAVHTLLG